MKAHDSIMCTAIELIIESISQEREGNTDVCCRVNVSTFDGLSDDVDGSVEITAKHRNALSRVMDGQVLSRPQFTIGL
jgi:hypothetical protein